MEYRPLNIREYAVITSLTMPRTTGTREMKIGMWIICTFALARSRRLASTRCSWEILPEGFYHDVQTIDQLGISRLLRRFSSRAEAPRQRDVV